VLLNNAAWDDYYNLTITFTQDKFDSGLIYNVTFSNITKTKESKGNSITVSNYFRLSKLILIISKMIKSSSM